MQQPLRISFRGTDASPAVEARIHELFERLDRLFQHMTSCHVVVDAPHGKHHQGQLYDVRIHIHVPGHEIVVNGDGSQDHAHEDVFVALRDAFAAVEHKLEHETLRHGHRSRRVASGESA